MEDNIDVPLHIAIKVSIGVAIVLLGMAAFLYCYLTPALQSLG
jgi:hypothetical protein